MHCGATLQQLFIGYRIPQRTEKTQSLSLQEGNGNLQLLLFEHDKDGEVEPCAFSGLPGGESLHPQHS